ncbi:glycosyltransferase family 2 protein [Micromonospora sp. NBC_01813]|uniref:glycosyltransferase family 2 protein n=1 Tax=Micromonospora sp. NBC_01813 TaxID=2975988 RepID=UPI002DDA997F|nr:glycosyltransferase family 2 protein [Micromonospora sp. NBC_01813]WSA10810.1 glycosyltransferase [Micromonospora sp. NBC_01813]
MRPEPPPVSVVMPVRDAADYLPQALAQLAAIEGPHEIVLVDDGSTDGGAELLTEFCRDRPDRRLVSLAAPVGAATARDRGIAQAAGRYIWCCDVDDEWEPGLVARLLQTATETDSDIVCCRAERVEADGRTWLMEGPDVAEIAGRSAFAGLVLAGTLRGYLWNKLFRASTLRPTNRRRLTSQDDFLVLLDALDRADRVAFVPDVLYRYVERPGSVSTGDALRLENTAFCCDEALARLGPRLPQRRRDATLGYFRLWFHAVPCATTPVHQGWDARVAAEVRRRARRHIRWRAIGTALRHRRVGLAGHALLIKTTGPLFPPLYRTARRLLQ